MTYIRTIKPEFWESEQVAAMSRPARLLFIGLWTIADNQGRVKDDPKAIKAAILKKDRCDINALLDEIVKAQFAHRKNGYFVITPKDTMGSKRNNSVMTTNARDWVKLRHIVFARDGHRCRYCGDAVGPFQVDHVVAIAKGGTDELSNLVVACRLCNIRKKDKSLQAFLTQYGLTLL